MQSGHTGRRRCSPEADQSVSSDRIVDGGSSSA
jgi:hypothetical protein